ncbi:MAG: helix-turn-helix domain-containing protein, partial [Planctomycetota bacterium]
ADHFLQKSAARSGRTVEGFSDAATKLLTGYRWPGNVRELKNAVERAVVLCRGGVVEPADLRLTAFAPPAGPADEAVATSLEQSGDRAAAAYRSVSLEVLEREHILATLAHTGWNKSKAASILGIERSTLDRKLKKYGVDRPGANA